MKEEYRVYNRAEVTIISGDEKYTISKVNTKAFPGKSCECHVESITINSPAVSSGNSANIGATGSVNIIDYSDAVFKFLANHLKKFLAKDSSNDSLFNFNSVDKSKISGKTSKELLPKIVIDIWCYAGPNPYTVTGSITSWDMQFSGTTPSINLSFTGVPADVSPLSRTDENKEDYDLLYSVSDWGEDKTDHGLLQLFNLIAKLSKIGPVPKVMFHYYDKTISNIKEICNDYLYLNPTNFVKNVPKKYGNFFYDAVSYLFSITKTKQIGDDTTKSQITTNCVIDVDGSVTIFTPDVEVSATKSDENSTLDELIFVFNGKYPAYSTPDIKSVKDLHGLDKRKVILVDSFKFDTKFSLLALSKSLTENINGTSVNDNDGGSKTINTNGDSGGAAELSAANDKASEAITFSFDCYNVMAFEVNNLAGSVKVLVYNELGEIHPVSGSAIVRKCTYTLSGAVVKASVECTKVFNRAIVDKTSTNDGGPPPAADVKPKEPEETVEDVPVEEKPAKKEEDPTKSLLEYLRSEDKYPVPVNLDNTANLIGEGGVFREQVDNFIKKYGDKSGYHRRIDFEKDIKPMLDSHNFGLFSLLICVANCGVGPEKDSMFDDWIDAPIYEDSFKNVKGINKFFSSSIGKLPYDHKSGGLGIAHWDSGNLGDIYENVGFDEKDTEVVGKDIWSDLLLSKGTILRWEQITTDFDGKAPPMSRFKPVLSKGAKIGLFGRIVGDDRNKPHKYRAHWLNWANKILHYKDQSRGRIYQYYIFEMWIKKFWSPVIESLKTSSTKEGHTISLQDAARISRIANSDGSTKCNSCNAKKYPGLSGCNNATQVDTYLNKRPKRRARRIKQLAFCRRTADIIGYLYHEGKIH